MSTQAPSPVRLVTGAAPGHPVGAPPAGRVARLRSGWFPRLLLLPSVVVLLVLTGWPLARLLVMSTQEYGRAQVFGQPAEFVGLENYRAVLTDPTFWKVLGRSIAFCAVNVTLTMVIGMLVALLLTRLGHADADRRHGRSADGLGDAGADGRSSSGAGCSTPTTASSTTCSPASAGTSPATRG